MIESVVPVSGTDGAFDILLVTGNEKKHYYISDNDTDGSDRLCRQRYR